MIDRPLVPAAYPVIGEEEVEAVCRVMRSGQVAQGPEVETFEQEFAERHSAECKAIAVNSGTSALHIGLLAMNLEPGDEVIVPSFTFAATGNAVALAGAKPVFADIDPRTFNISAESVEQLISSRTRAVMPVHLYGLPADMTALSELAERHDLRLAEDAAQAHFAAIDGRRVGTFGHFGAFSFYPTKNMTSGEGGMITTQSEEAARVMRLYRNQGMERRYHNEVIGLNNRMTDIHAAIGRVQLQKLDAWTEQRIQIAEKFSENITGVATPYVPQGYRHVYHQYTIRLDGSSGAERDRFADALKDEHGIGSGVYYPVPIHQLPSLSHFHDGRALPNTDRAAAECLSLPVHPSLQDADIERIITAVNALAGAA